MKLHTLRLCAFGPFPGQETVDFDALGAEGLFLLRGRTGSGKTSVLDAVTFALYGKVPGERDHNMLKSHHAPPEREPVVELEFSCGEQRWWVRRTPPYWRPGRANAVGSTIQLKRLLGGDWEPVTSGVQAANAELQQILGLNVDQFTKVILLPQGDFAEFLHASSKEKQELLERLFDTHRFRALEMALAEAAKAAEEQISRLQAQIEHQASTLRRDAALLLGAEHCQEQQLDLDGTPEDQLGELVAQEAATVHRQLTARTAQAAQAAQDARREAEHQAARRRELLAYQQYQQDLAAHQGQAEAAEASRRLRDRHMAAVQIASWLKEAESAQQQAASAQAEAQLEARRAAQVLAEQNEVSVDPLTDAEGLPQEAAIETVLERLTALRSSLTEQDARQLEDQQAALRNQAQQLRQQAEEARQAQEQLQAEIETLGGRREELAAEQTDLEQLDQQRQAAQQQLQAASHRAELTQQRDAAAQQQQRTQRAAEEAQQQAQVAAQSHTEAVRRRLDGLAVELAEELQPGKPCRVCGGTEHPAPLQAVEHTVSRQEVDRTRKAERQALTAAESARAAYDAARARLEELSAALAEHGQTSTAEAARLAEQAQQRLDQLDAERTRQRRLSVQLQELTEQLHTLQQQHAESGHRAERCADQAQRAEQDAQQLEHRLATLRGVHPSVQDRLQLVEACAQALHQALEAHRQHQNRLAQAASTAEAAQREITGSPFTGAEEAAAAVLDDQQLAEAEQIITAYQDEAKRLEFTAAQAEVTAGRRRHQAAEQLPSQEAVEAAAEQAAAAEEQLQGRRKEQTAFEARQQGVTDCISALGQALAAKGAQAGEQQLRADLAAAVNGRGQDNPMRMTLTTFVLAAKLEQVALAASRHLLTMSEGRYRLLHDDEGGSGAAKKGLDLKVHDEHSDEYRPTSSLSGGETFMASLAMALGLAETVQSESGGLGMESLFIDEGFGSLDDQTLEAVMTALHTLQGEGRRIGVVSHVTEMHQQIPVQLKVTKTTTGSTLTMVGTA